MSGLARVVGDCTAVVARPSFDVGAFPYLAHGQRDFGFGEVVTARYLLDALSADAAEQDPDLLWADEVMHVKNHSHDATSHLTSGARMQDTSHMTRGQSLTLLKDSRGGILRARTFSATAIHTPRPDDKSRTLCGGTVMLLGEYACGPDYGCKEDPGAQCPADGFHRIDLTACAGADPRLCKRCEASITARASLTDRARQLGQQHHDQGITPFGDSGRVCFDEGGAELIAALGVTGPVTDDNAHERLAAVEAYCDALDAGTPIEQLSAECTVYAGIQFLGALVTSPEGRPQVAALADPGSWAEIGDAGVLLHGEYRLHASAPGTAWLALLDGETIAALECSQPVYLTHPEHGTIGIGHGTRTISRVRHGLHGFCREHTMRIGGSWPACSTPTPAAPNNTGDVTPAISVPLGANDRLCSCGAVITLISGRWIEADGTAMHGGPGNWAPHQPLNDAQREG